MSKGKSKPITTKYYTLTGIANDKLGERFGAGEVVDLSKWPTDDIEWLLGKGAITTEAPPKAIRDE